MDIERHKYGLRNFGARSPRYSGGQYVYYQRLGEKFPLMWLQAESSFDNAISKSANFANLATYFLQAAEEEKKKEIQLLERFFGDRVRQFFSEGINGTFSNADFASNLVKAFNYALQTKEIFEREAAFVLQTEGQKDSYTFFAHYFLKAFEASLPELTNAIIEGIKKTAFLGKTEAQWNSLARSAIRQVLNQKLRPIVAEGIRRMFQAKAGNGISENKQEHDMAFLQIAKHFQDTGAGSLLIDGFIETFHLDEIAEDIAKNYDRKEKVVSLSNELLDRIESSVWTRGGISLEFVENYLLNTIHNVIGSGGSDTISYHIEAIHSGQTGIKADNILTVGFDPNIVKDWLTEGKFGGRKENAQRIKELQDRLATLDDGFIVYVSDKNNQISEGFFKRGGFQSEERVNLANLSGLFDNLDVNIDTLITSIMQLSNGAIGEGKDKDIKNILARLVAASMFDDINEIGRHSTTGVQSIHLFNLGGNYFPLSVYFSLLGQAFNSAIKDLNMKDIHKLISISLDYPKDIVFPSDEDQGVWERENNASHLQAWEYQRNYMMTNTHVGYHFLKGFKEILANLLN